VTSHKSRHRTETDQFGWPNVTKIEKLLEGSYKPQKILISLDAAPVSPRGMLQECESPAITVGDATVRCPDAQPMASKTE